MKKVLCPMHNDTNPSLHIYGDWAYCFVCHASIATREIDLPQNFKSKAISKDATNVPKMVEYIDQLPCKEIRGFNLPYDQMGYYLVWPDNKYYKRRNWGEPKNRYTSPSGVSKPLFTCPSNVSKLCIVEGEFNALSLNKAMEDEYRVCSPGPASDLLRYIKYYLQFNEIIISVDYDGPGVVFGCYLKDVLLKNHRKARLIATEVDYNETYQKGGETAVRHQFADAMALSPSAPAQGLG